jgi:hypothetical protein
MTHRLMLQNGLFEEHLDAGGNSSTSATRLIGRVSRFPEPLLSKTRFSNHHFSVDLISEEL